MTVVTAARGGDAALVQRILDGDREAFTDLLRHHDAKLRSLAYKLLGGDHHLMEDALQNAYLKAYRSLSSFRDDAQLGTWLYRIVHNECVDELRRTARVTPFDPATRLDMASPDAGPEQRVADADAVLRALARLPDEQRSTVVLVDGEGFDTAAAAAILGVAPGTVASRLSRARAALRSYLEGGLHD